MKLTGTMMVAFAVAAAGCLALPSNTAPTAGTEGNETPPNPEVPADELLLTGCLAFQAFLNYPSAIAPNERPEGWGPISPGYTPSVSIYALKCERVALAGFERGPIHLLFDSHGNVSPPIDCKADTGQNTGFRALQHLMLDDPEIATYLQSHYGVPTLLATFNEQDRDVGANAFHDWSWTIGRAAPSTVTIIDAEENHSHQTERKRFFWQVGNDLGSLYYELEGNGSIIEPPANGTIQPPMLLASDTGGHFVGQAAWFDGAHVQGVFTRYADLACKEPLT